MNGCNCETADLLIAVAIILAGLAVVAVVLGSLGFSVLRTIRHLRANTLRLVSEPRERVGGTSAPRNDGDSPRAGFGLWIGLLFGVFLVVVGASLYMIGNVT